LEFFWIFWGIFWEYFKRIFWEEFFGRNILGEIFWEDFLGRIFLGGFFWRIFLGGFSGRTRNLDPLKCGGKLIALKN
jgi:hypothetical protein